MVGYSIKFNARSAEAAELMAIREGLFLAKKSDINHLELETDAEGLKKMITTAEKLENHELGAIIRDIQTLLNGQWIVVVLPARRQANGVANCLAKYGQKMEDPVKIHHEVPECAAVPYNQDQNGCLTNVNN